MNKKHNHFGANEYYIFNIKILYRVQKCISTTFNIQDILN